MTRRTLPRLLLPLLLLSACTSAADSAPEAVATTRTPELALDHVWIAVAKSGPERALLERAGFRFAPTVNEHEGQGTASITIEFENGFFELIWADEEVAATGTSAIARQRFASRASWRTSGDSPFGIGFRRTPATPAQFPFETWSVTAPWMEPGSRMEVLSPRGSKTVTPFVSPSGVDEAANLRAIAAGNAAAEAFRHPNGARRLTGVRITAPNAEALPPSADFVNATGAIALRVGGAWLMELELDRGAQRETRDFRPEIPLVIRF